MLLKKSSRITIWAVPGGTPPASGGLTGTPAVSAARGTPPRKKKTRAPPTRIPTTIPIMNFPILSVCRRGGIRVRRLLLLLLLLHRLTGERRDGLDHEIDLGL